MRTGVSGREKGSLHFGGSYGRGAITCGTGKGLSGLIAILSMASPTRKS